jgi:hypothetical protein
MALRKSRQSSVLAKKGLLRLLMNDEHLDAKDSGTVEGENGALLSSKSCPCPVRIDVISRLQENFLTHKD